MHFRVSLLAVLALGGVSGGAEAAIKVNATINGTPLQCADAINVRVIPALTRTNMRFTYECVADGIERTCVPAAYVDPGTGDDYLQNGDPAIKYRPFAAQGGPVISVVCDGETSVAERGTEFVGEIDGVAIAGCHPAVPVSQNPASLWTVSSRPADQCVGTAASVLPAQCVEFRCPNDTANRTCFPVTDVTYASRLTDDQGALRRVSLQCETLAPMLSHGFDE